MGLDMFLTIRDSRGNESEFYYWRKANQIREWFARHFANFDRDANAERGKWEVTKEMFESLINDIELVLEHPKLAQRVLPTSEGFFFGGTDYDEYYFDQLEQTLENLKIQIPMVDFETEKIYYSEWW